MRSNSGESGCLRRPAAPASGLARTLWLALTWLPFAAVQAVAANTAEAPGPHAAETGRATSDTLRDVIALVDAGAFERAGARIAADLGHTDPDDPQHQALTFQRERMRRIRMDFPLRAADVRAALQRDIPDLRDEEFAAWDVPSLLEQITIDGEKRYFQRAVPNLYRVHVAARLRRAEPWTTREGPMERLHPHHAKVVAAARAGGRVHVLPRRVRIEQTLTVDADAVPAGTVLRAWIPYPRPIPGQQERIELLGSEPDAHRLAPEETLQRTVYLEQPARSGEPTRFAVRYELTIAARHHAIDPARVQPLPAPAELAEFVAERPPHIVFSDAMRRYSAEVVGEETHPLRIARRLFEAVDRIPWGSAREYSTISNIGEHALRASHADCGQQTLLLMTLLRMNGIPARWQSGMVFSDGDYDNLHDWGQLYLAPYGWVPMDVTTGVLASDDPALRWFYLGSLDGYRIAFNDDYSTPLVPAKHHVRSETVDSQRGEVEWDGGNLYYDQWDYGFKAELL